MAANHPKRIQLSRKAGWRMPANTVKVARPSGWGNPFVVGQPDHLTDEVIADRAHAVRLFDQRWFGTESHFAEFLREAARGELRGKNLACWCPLDQPCHADVLLRVANAP